MSKLGIISFAHIHALNYAAALTKSNQAELVTIWYDGHHQSELVKAKDFPDMGRCDDVYLW